jgi:hypothetical protein
VVALGVAACLALGEDPLEAARRRVPLGADRATVEAAVGRPADDVGRVRALPGEPALPEAVARRFELIWRYRDATLLVHFDEDERSFLADVDRQSSPFWERFRAWLGF